MKTLSIAFATILAAAAAGRAASADTSLDPTHQRVVRFADLDLSKPADVEKLHRRVWITARDLCWKSGVMSIYDGPAMQSCTKDAAERALAEVQSSMPARVVARDPRDTKP